VHRAGGAATQSAARGTATAAGAWPADSGGTVTAPRYPATDPAPTGQPAPVRLSPVAARGSPHDWTAYAPPSGHPATTSRFGRSRPDLAGRGTCRPAGGGCRYGAASPARGRPAGTGA